MFGKYKFLGVLLLFHYANCLPDEGKWDYNLTTDHDNLILPKSLFKGSQIFINLNCENPNSKVTNISISWVVVLSQCWLVDDALTQVTDYLRSSVPLNSTESHRSLDKVYPCNDKIILDEHIFGEGEKSLGKTHPVYVVLKDGVYVLGLRVTSINGDFNLGVHVEMKSSYGYLAAADWPLLPFYGFMCIFYVILGLIWMILSFMQWRDLLRVQFWIGGVILLGMLEKATFYAEYQSINNTGSRVEGAMLFAEWISCAKRTLARMLVIIVSLGFGIVKPRLGAALHRVVGVGLLYFFLASYESYLRITKRKSEQRKDLLVASVPLAVLDSAICWWIFSALVNTTRTLRLRRNEVKLALYRHFTNTLIFAVFASRYAFVPFLEAGDEEEEEQLVNDAYGVKVRIHHNKQQKTSSVDDDIKWLEDNVTINPPLPVLDSDEELVNTRFEVSKMQ
ncbi:lung seven transmembrane receptor [Holotrichia oblita]|uniref:Lung seven transmembrane receptor n=1 Tax=Holotrichia oblita TaxID=644536 RepID=A0ACB9T7A9_HOLOL|nr:lung seven transmembrane receptor [Holotrichia oblita]